MGELPKSLKSWVSVTIFVGIIFKIAILSGRISCDDALFSVITKILSSFNVFAAGNLSGILIGIRTLFCGAGIRFCGGSTAEKPGFIP